MALRTRSLGVVLLAATASCAHVQLKSAPPDAVAAQRASVRAFLESLPICLADEWQDATSIAALRAAPFVPGAQVRVRGVFRPILAFRAQLGCISLEKERHSRSEPSDSLEPPCCGLSTFWLQFADEANPSEGLWLSPEPPPPTLDGCAAGPVQKDLASVPVLVWGTVEGQRHAGRVEPDRVCRGRLLPPLPQARWLAAAQGERRWGLLERCATSAPPSAWGRRPATGRACGRPRSARRT